MKITKVLAVHEVQEWVFLYSLVSQEGEGLQFT